MSEEILAVTGMTCGGCVKSVDTVLSAVPGVQRVEVSLEHAQAKVSYDAAQTSRSALVQAVVDAGFGVGA
jgi:copper chaperone